MRGSTVSNIVAMSVSDTKGMDCPGAPRARADHYVSSADKRRGEKRVQKGEQ